MPCELLHELVPAAVSIGLLINTANPKSDVTRGAVDIAGMQRAAFQVTELIEHEQRVITGAGVMAVPHAILLLAVGRAHARIHVEHDAAGRSAAVHKVDPL